MKKYLALILIMIFTITLSGCKKKTVEKTQAPVRPVENINQLAVTERPFVTLTPRADGHELTLTVDEVKNAANVDYEIEYYDSQRTYIEGAVGHIDFSQEVPPVSKKILLGTCSKNVCRYRDEGVSGGSLTLRFVGGDNPYTLKSDFNLQVMADRQGIFITNDAKATLDVGKTGLASSTFVTVASTMGLPGVVEGQILAGPYAFLAATSPNLAKATISIKSKEDLTTAKLLFWTGKAWKELVSTLAEGQISAPATSLGTFIVVK